MSGTIPRWAERGRIIPLYTEAGPINVLKGCLSKWPIMRSPAQIHRWCNLYNREDIVRELKRESVNFVMAGWSVGFSLEAEAIQRDLVSDFIKRCHASGIRVGTYLSWSNLFWESMFEAVPESKTWCRLDSAGEPEKLFGLEPRRAACVNNNGWWRALKKRVSLALASETDMIFLDNVCGACHCSCCKALFRAYTKKVLGKAYSLPADMQGLPYKSYLQAKERMLRNDRDSDQLRALLAAFDFEAERIAVRMRAMRAHIKSRKPDVLLAGNVKEYVVANRLCDVLLSEDPTFPGMEGRGPVTNIPLYKQLFATGRGEKSTITLLGQRRMDEGRNPRVQKLALAEGAAFGMQPGCHQMCEFVQRDYNRFFLRHQNYYAQTRPVAKIGVIEDDERPVAGSVIGQHAEFQNQLAHRNIPFDLLFQRDLTPSLLSRYHVLILHNPMVMGEKAIRLIRRFVQRGGNLLSTGFPAVIRPDYTRRDDYGLSDVLGVSLGKGQRPRARVDNVFGKGRSVFYRCPIAEIDPRNPARPAPRVPAGFFRDVRRLTGSPLIQVSGPRCVLAHLMKKEGADRIMVHLLNYSCKRARDVRIRLQSHGDLKGRVKLLSPDNVSGRVIRPVRRNDSIEFGVPEILVYCLALVE